MLARHSKEFEQALETTPRLGRSGTLNEIVGTSLIATLPGVQIAELVEIVRGTDAPLLAEVVGFTREHCVLSAYGETVGISPGATVRSIPGRRGFYCGSHLLGLALDAAGSPLAGIDESKPRAAIPEDAEWRNPNPPPPALAERCALKKQTLTGVFSIDHFTPIACGQRIGLFAEPGIGKTSLLNQINRNAKADVKVIALIGERTREVEEALREMRGPNTVLIASSSSESAASRARAAETAFSVAEHFRAQGRSVLLLVDSLSRLFRAYRELGLAGGETPVRRGYPASAFARLPGLLERAGNTERGSITAIFTLLLSDEIEQDPVVDEVKGLLDGHIILSKELAQRGLYPAIDITSSLSRLETSLLSDEQLLCLKEIRTFHAEFKDTERMIKLGAPIPANHEQLKAMHSEFERLLYREKEDVRDSWSELLALRNALIETQNTEVPNIGTATDPPNIGNTVLGFRS